MGVSTSFLRHFHVVFDVASSLLNLSLLSANEDRAIAEKFDILGQCWSMELYLNVMNMITMVIPSAITASSLPRPQALINLADNSHA
jgi:hypothetical protein